MARTVPGRRIPRRRLVLHRAPARHAGLGAPPPVSDLVAGLLGVILLGGLALAAAYVLTAGPAVP